MCALGDLFDRGGIKIMRLHSPFVVLRPFQDDHLVMKSLLPSKPKYFSSYPSRTDWVVRSETVLHPGSLCQVTMV